MKKRILLFGALALSSISFAQQFPHVATSNGNAERVASFRVNDSSTEFLEITNSTNVGGQFIPSLWAHHQADNRFVFREFITTNSAQDNGTIPMMIYRAEIRNGLNLGAPNGSGDFPWGTTASNVVNRPLFAWENGNTQLMRILANGNVGIGTTTPTTRFHTFGSVRFESIPTVTTNTYVLTADANGVVSRQLSSSFGGGGITNACATPNFLTKTGTSGLTCSQVFDNGTNVGINTTAPTAKFHNNGTVRFENLPTSTTNNIFVTSDASGNLARRTVTFGNVNSTCFTANFIPKNNGTGLSCSQIFDNGTNVGIGTTTPSNKLTVNGAVQSISNLFISDIIYKEKIAPINNALELVNGLDGKTYNWKVSSFPDLNFDNTLQYGLIAQEVETVMPSIVHTDALGRKAVNYSAIIPVLVEAIKQQQDQITALQDQINTNFQRQNNELITLQNTKIISVSPNPSSDVISVSMNIESEVTEAKLVVYDLKGAVINSLTIKDRGYDISKSFQKDNFGTGTYIVTLVVNGKSIDSKKFIFN